MVYADEPGRRRRQLVFDAVVLAWVVMWAWAGIAVYRQTASAESGARDLSAGGVALRTNMSSAADAVRDVPLVGDRLRAPLAQAQGAGTSMDQAGQHLGSVIETLAQVMGSITAAIPISLALLAWAVVRLSLRPLRYPRPVSGTDYRGAGRVGSNRADHRRHPSAHGHQLRTS